jgi:aspartyl-tRNA(Asn)/glutamyl-tRNA(Gln) amidotransferase subunit B
MLKLIDGWEVVIGLEVHAQISSPKKLFSNSSTAFGSSPNSQVSFYDAAFPGMLPVINRFCVEQAVKTGLAIGGTVHEVSVFDRKNYFYPDLPAGYQISQFHHPIITGGYIVIEAREVAKIINIERIHIEQDAGKSIHDLDVEHSLIDLNRAGIPLMEIVSKPDMRSSLEAMLYVKKLRTILRYIGTCNGNMEQGNLRVDANVSIHKPGTSFGTRAEIKNVNSIKFLGQAIDYEVARQISIINDGGSITQETRLFDSGTGATKSMRSKENADDYRYFPEPDLQPVVLTDKQIQIIRKSLPELPDDKKGRFMSEYEINESDADILVEDIVIANEFEKAVHASRFPNSAKAIANWMIGDLFAILNKSGMTIENLQFPIEHLAVLVDMITDGTISGKIAKTVLQVMFDTQENPAQIVKDMNLGQVSNESVLRTAISKIIDINKDKVEEYRQGKEKLFGFFVGESLKATQGKGNPITINKILKELLQ